MILFEDANYRLTKNTNGKRLKTQMAAKRKISAMITNISK